MFCFSHCKWFAEPCSPPTIYYFSRHFNETPPSRSLTSLLTTSSRPSTLSEPQLFKKRAGSELMLDMRSQAISGQYKNFTRMSPADCENILSRISSKIAKQTTYGRSPISAQDKFNTLFPRLIIDVRDCRLAVTLRYLATEDSYTSLMSKQSIGRIIPDVCAALLPKTPLAWKEISKTFETDWNVPHCVGALDGKQVLLQTPAHSGSDFYNYKSNFSIVILARFLRS
ncbi:hypothetical protein PR048_007345 [Dryococelus australis]|uniref:DDE Tnp4 domain-containing protein n=1 Tax=Dryococelus australis TaxID=614101 RepID=A0ABQ9IDB9_9NEOP|nr:hypothetical protein PR048_007345 [Dryococelus australis]